MKVEIRKNKLYVTFKYNPSLISAIREIPGRRWNPNTKEWIIPDTPTARRMLKNLGFNIPNDEKPKIQVKFPEYLLPFQKDGVKFLLERNGRGLIADEMGLGKTLQAITYVTITNTFPALVVCPATLKWNWAAEIQKWTKYRDIAILEGRKPVYFTPPKFTIINYDIVAGWFPTLQKMEFKTIIMDESHYIKNPKANRTRAVVELARKIPHIIALTGTPIINRPIEIFPTLNLLEPTIFKSRWGFAKRYCALHHNGFGWVMNGSSNEEELHELLKNTVMIRRTKNEVLSQLPKKFHTVIPVDIDLSKYNEMVQKLVTMYGISHKVTGNILSQIAQMRHEIGIRKIPLVVKWIEDFRDANPNGKLVLFGWHKVVLAEIAKRFRNHTVVITGDTPGGIRHQYVQKFQNDPNTWLFVGSIRATNVGITLTAANTVVFAEMGWTPSEHDQAEDRVHRIGQDRGVNVYFIVARGTIDEYMAEIVDCKRTTISQIIDGKEENPEAIITELLQRVIHERV